jgi:hypothetical protein
VCIYRDVKRHYENQKKRKKNIGREERINEKRKRKTKI